MKISFIEYNIERPEIIFGLQVVLLNSGFFYYEKKKKRDFQGDDVKTIRS